MKVRAIWNGPESTSVKWGRLVPGKEYQVEEADMASLSFKAVPETRVETKFDTKKEKEVG